MNDESYVLRDIVRDLVKADGFEEAKKILLRLGQGIGLPIPGVVPDIGRPYFSKELDESFRYFGWPAEILETWWQRTAAIKVAFYVRCRFSDLPFVIDLSREKKLAPLTNVS